MKSRYPYLQQHAESVLDLEGPAGAVDEVDDDGGVVGLSENDRVRLVVRSNISGEHRACKMVHWRRGNNHYRANVLL